MVQHPVDATAVPAELTATARTVFNAFHHFPPELARSILADCVNSRSAVFILECFPRDPRRLLSILPGVALAMAVNPLLAERDRALKAIGTYLVPVIPAAGAWDGLISTLRVHTPDDLRSYVEDLDPSYVWEHHEVPYPPGGRLLVFLGLPTRAARS
jgi:hypothetical protein